MEPKVATCFDLEKTVRIFVVARKLSKVGGRFIYYMEKSKLLYNITNKTRVNISSVLEKRKFKKWNEQSEDHRLVEHLIQKLDGRQEKE